MREFRSHYGQGYLFSRPVDATTLDHLLAQDKTRMELA
jgi:EAL domain-containing protein (putative c-di-GMP-specific phosphodiesterase class I)